MQSNFPYIMKIATFLLISILLIGVHTTQAQTPVTFKQKSDPGYSVHNYKHPHKAAIPKKYNLDQTAGIPYPGTGQANNLTRRSYKAQRVSNDGQTQGVVVIDKSHPSNRQSIESPANYKRQFKPESSSAR